MLENEEIKKLLEEIHCVVERANAILSKEVSEKWDRKYINDLPNAAFAVIEKGYTEGKNRNARHLP